ncbi:MAG: hypothetical protein M3P40_05090 [Actinomycetota bacterium]|nr:hypothetical protein [Actinomycetota bacterium]
MQPDWLGACRRATATVREMLQSASTSEQRLRETGTIGEGGDRTLEIDAAAEEAMFKELEQLHEQGATFSVISEERGAVAYGAELPLVVIDPIDGSTNAKRGLRHHALSVAVADGETMGDVFFGFVHDFGPEEEWVAERGQGAMLNGAPLDRSAPERRMENGKLELLGIESSDPRWIREVADGLADSAHRIRALGTIAISLCQVADARFDGMLSIRRCRAVDAAAAQLIVREAGGEITFPGCETALGAPLDIKPHFPIVAARTQATLDELAQIPIISE